MKVVEMCFYRLFGQALFLNSDYCSCSTREYCRSASTTLLEIAIPCCTVNQLLKTVVREIRRLRSVGLWSLVWESSLNWMPQRSGCALDNPIPRQIMV